MEFYELECSVVEFNINYGRVLFNVFLTLYSRVLGSGVLCCVVDFMLWIFVK